MGEQPDLHEIAVDPNAFHPWMDLLIPGDQAVNLLTYILDQLNAEELEGGAFVIYPVVPDRIQSCSLRLPRSHFCILAALLPSIPYAGAGNLPHIADRNRKIYRRARDLGGFIYPIGSVTLSASDWREHLGTGWNAFRELKQRYDPNQLLAPGQGFAL
jgi:FAD/FMN-containing dehydrogenase